MNSPTGREIARWLGFLNATSRKYKKARTEEWSAQPVGMLVMTLRCDQEPILYSSRSMAIEMVRDAGCASNWGDL